MASRCRLLASANVGAERCPRNVCPVVVTTLR
jgi:hypothetical protein